MLPCAGPKLRNARAKLLGYESHAHYMLEVKMAGAPATVADFLEKVQIQLQGQLDIDIAALKHTKATKTPDKDGMLAQSLCRYPSGHLLYGICISWWVGPYVGQKNSSEAPFD